MWAKSVLCRGDEWIKQVDFAMWPQAQDIIFNGVGRGGDMVFHYVPVLVNSNGNKISKSDCKVDGNARWGGLTRSIGGMRAAECGITPAGTLGIVNEWVEVQKDCVTGRWKIGSIEVAGGCDGFQMLAPEPLYACEVYQESGSPSHTSAYYMTSVTVRTTTVSARPLGQSAQLSDGP